MRIRQSVQSPNADLTRRIKEIHWSNVLTWTLQGVLALLFLFAGLAKLMMPIHLLVAQSGLPAVFLRFIAVSEIMGALGLILPGHFGIHRDLTPLAAAGLVVIMIGAVSMTAVSQGAAPAVFPLVVGMLLTLVIRVRRSPVLH